MPSVVSGDVQSPLQLCDRAAQLLAAAEAGRDLDHITPLVERRHFEDLRQLELGRAVGHRKHGDRALDTGGVVKLDDLGAVGGVGKLQAEDLGVLLGLLQAVARLPVGGLGFDHRDREVVPIAQQIVRPPLPAAPRLAAGEDDAPAEDVALQLEYLEERAGIPARQVNATSGEVADA